MLVIGIALGVALAALLSGPARMLIAMKHVDMLDGPTVKELLAVSRFGGTSYTQNRISNAARLVALKRFRVAHPASTDADAAVYLAALFGQGNPLLHFAVYPDGMTKLRRMLMHAGRIAVFALKY